ncbi:Thylakoid lumenal 16.5 kDa protein, partial [Musa troglodytarum]
DRKKRLQRQGVISSSDKEKGYLQELIYKLSKVGQALENDDLTAASSLLGPSTNADWVKNLSTSPEEKTEVDNFNSSLTSLFRSVGDRDIESSKLAFVSSASALEKWEKIIPHSSIYYLRLYRLQRIRFSGGHI